jgi:hypothetical protein
MVNVRTLACTVQITQFLPTHCERCDGTVNGAIRWLRAGGNIDMTAGHQVQGVARCLRGCCKGRPGSLQNVLMGGS